MDIHQSPGLYRSPGFYRLNLSGRDVQISRQLYNLRAVIPRNPQNLRHVRLNSDGLLINLTSLGRREIMTGYFTKHCVL